jgi:uncharacterized membrane protein
MIKNPYALAAILLSIEVTILYLASADRTRHLFSFIPSIFWIYFLPMMASSVGLIDSKSPLYGQVTNLLLPMSLFILLVTVDLRAILRLGPKALMMFFAGGLGVGAGVVLAFAVFKPWIGSHFWSGFGTLAGSWTGGSANMIAVKEALGTPDAVFLPMVIVDTIVPYVWMGILVIASQHQKHYDRLNHSDRSVLDDLSHKIRLNAHVTTKMALTSTLAVIAIALAGGTLARYVSQFLPVIKDVISGYAWTIILVSTFGIVLSLTPLRRIEAHGSNKIGYFILYFVLTTIGAKASISNMGNAMILIAAGWLIVLVHATVLLITARLIRAPLFLAAVASQANVGGVASAPMVAEIYQKGFASVGLLLAILGNIVGSYVGIAVGQICRLLA